MNKLILTETGGLHFDEDILDFVLSSLRDPLNGMFGDAGNDLVIVSGMVVTPGAGLTNDMSPGWFYYQGELYKCAGGNYGLALVGNVIGIKITETAANVEFDDAPYMRPVKLTRVGELGQYAIGTPGVVTLADFRRWNEVQADAAGVRAIEPWQSMASGQGTLPGTIWYRRNMISRLLHVRGSITVNNAQAITEPVPVYSLGILPAIYRPNYTAPFSGLVRAHSDPDRTDAAIRNTYMAVVGTGPQHGTVEFRPNKPTSVAVASYLVEFNHTLPLD
jgi:hypothetical protein